jgi:hypothetical protein
MTVEVPREDRVEDTLTFTVSHGFFAGLPFGFYASMGSELHGKTEDPALIKQYPEPSPFIYAYPTLKPYLAEAFWDRHARNYEGIVPDFSAVHDVAVSSLYFAQERVTVDPRMHRYDPRVLWAARTIDPLSFATSKALAIPYTRR